MKIIFISDKSYPVFEVYDENKKLIHIKIDHETRAFRIMCNDNRRVFFIENEMIKKTEITTLLNEYSQQLGFLTKSKLDISMGEIEIDGTQYKYKMKDGLSKEINLFEHNNFQPILSCKLEMEQLSFLNKDYISYLLFGLVWFLFLTRKQETPVQLAEA
ncbi:MAG: hypothetical protein ABI863_02835 [Ginsengibacter sp.]